MVDINFEIPYKKEELLNQTSGFYYVRNVTVKSNILSQLQDARLSLRDLGPEFILEYFDLFFSILYQSDTMELSWIMDAYRCLNKAMRDLNNNLNFIFEQKEMLINELQTKFVNILKMLLYVYSNTVLLIENKSALKQMCTLKVTKERGRSKSVKDDEFEGYDKSQVLLNISHIMDREINLFWDPPIVDKSLINLVSSVCFCFLENPTIKSNKELRVEVFNTLGILIKSHSLNMSFVIQMAQMIRTHDHLINCLPEGIKILVENYNCKTLVPSFIREVTEWQTKEQFEDNQGTKNCSQVLVEMAKLMPQLMIPEVMYLNTYLDHDSYVLRNSILSIITEIVLEVLTKHDLTEEEMESRDDLLGILQEHIWDVSAQVRSKVFQHWTRLQTQNAIPRNLQPIILQRAVEHLIDKGAIVRKNAAVCVTQFLSHNPFGAQLELSKLREELERKTALFEKLQQELFDPEQQELIEKWNKMEQELKDAIEEHLKNRENIQPIEQQQSNSVQAIRDYLDEHKYTEAIELTLSKLSTFEEWKAANDSVNENKKKQMLYTLMHSIYTNRNISNKNQTNTQERIEELESLRNNVVFLKDAVGFLDLLDKAMTTMQELLFSSSVSDAQEAVNFFVTAYKFQLENSMSGVLTLLKLMQAKEQDRRDMVVNAFKTIFLTTDATNTLEHTCTVTDRLINLFKSASVSDYSNLKLIISDWTAKGILDNSVIDTMWKYFTKKIEVTDEQSCYALQLLGIAAEGRKSIITKNVKVVTSIAFGDRGMNDLLLLKAACDILTITGSDRVDIRGKEGPYCIVIDDPMWNDLFDILCKKFTDRDKVYNNLMSSVISLIYKVCSKPQAACEQLVDRILHIVCPAQAEDQAEELETFIIRRIVHLYGEIAIKVLDFLDDKVYRELKRRIFIKEELKHENKDNKGKRRSYKASDSAMKSKRNITNTSSLSTVTEDNESILEGAQADDQEAEYILHVLENDIVTGSGPLAKMGPIIRKLCETPTQDIDLTRTAVISLLRYMLVSSRFCNQNLQLIFTLLEKSPHPDIKCTILFHCSDLLERFPNAIEPWTSRIYNRLKDTCNKVRKVTFFVLSNLVLRDMILPHGHLSEMAICLVDEDPEIKQLSNKFFLELSGKVDNMYNELPDIFSHLCDLGELEEKDLKYIMKYLFGLINKNKQLENLVERFCIKFSLTDDEKKCANIAYCLTLITYNDKALSKLLDHFDLYKHLLHNKDIYALFEEILNNANKQPKNEIKTLVTELQQKVQGIFEMNKDSPMNESQQVFKKPKGRAVKQAVKKPKKTAKKSKTSSDDSDSEEYEQVSPKPSPRTSGRSRRRPALSEDSD